MYKAYQAEQVLLTEEMKRKREEDIILKEKEAKDFQKDKFGVDGELFKKRQELVQPLQEEIYNAIKQIAQAEALAIVFDKATQSNISYLPIISLIKATRF
jgi:outer membrane protein